MLGRQHHHIPPSCWINLPWHHRQVKRVTGQAQRVELLVVPLCGAELVNYVVVAYLGSSDLYRTGILSVNTFLPVRMIFVNVTLTVLATPIRQK